MARKTKATTTEEIIVTGKDYLREAPANFSSRILSSDNSPLLMLYENYSSNIDYGIKQAFPQDNENEIVYFVHGCEKGNGKPQKMKKDKSSSYYGGRCTCKYCGKELSPYSGFCTKEDTEIQNRRYPE